MLKLITGAAENVYPRDDALLHMGMVGDSMVFADIGEEMEATIRDNNTIRVASGVGLFCGAEVMIDTNTYEDFTIETGAQGAERYDLIGFTITESGIQKTVKKNAGKSGGEQTGDFWSDNSIFRALYRVHISGLTITEVERIFVLHRAGGKSDTYPTFFNCERVIGTYAGRTEYEYVFSTLMTDFESDPATGWTDHTYTLPFTGVEKVISICGEIRSNTSHEAWALPYVSWKSGTIATHLWTLKPNGNLIVLNKGSAKWTRDYWLIITIRYTKE